MKTFIRILIALLVLVLLGATAMVLVAEGGLMWMIEPVIKEREAPAIATEAVEVPSPESTEATDSEKTPLADGVADAPQTGEKETEPSKALTAKNYFVYDVRDEKLLKQKGKLNGKLYPASITKLMTSYVVLQHMKPKDTVVVGADALALVDPDSSLAWLQLEDTLTVEQLIAAMLLPSGNDAAHVTAVACGRKISGKKTLDAKEAEAVFMKEMNKQAKKLGMTGSHFVTPDGFHDPDHYTSMQDLITLSCKILTEPTILKYTSTTRATAKTPTRSLTWNNTNVLLSNKHEFYIPSTIGLKTGYTDAAGSCMMSAFFEEDRLILIGVFGCPRSSMDRYKDTVKLYNSIT